MALVPGRKHSRCWSLTILLLLTLTIHVQLPSGRKILPTLCSQLLMKTFFPLGRLYPLVPIILPSALLILKILAVHPDYQFGLVSLDLIFVGFTWDIWALTTIISGRWVVGGGIHSFPSEQAKRKNAQFRQSSLCVLVLVFHLFFFVFLLKSGRVSGSFSVPATMAGFLFGIGMPTALLLPVLIKEEQVLNPDA